MDNINIPVLDLGSINLTSLFFDAFAILFSLMYLVYCLVQYRQTVIMLRTIRVNDSGLIQRQNMIKTISLIQMLFGMLLLIFSFFLLTL